jgi:hypothetical protein
LWKKILLGVILALTTPLVILTVWAAKMGFARQTQHANPGQSRQPTRSTELNVVICEKEPDPSVPNRAVVDFREGLWREHLGFAGPLPAPVSGWVKLWEDRADEKLKNLQQDPKKGVGQRKKYPAKVLKWTPQVDPEKYLKGLGLPMGDLKVRSKADAFDFKTGKWKK